MEQSDEVLSFVQRVQSCAVAQSSSDRGVAAIVETFATVPKCRLSGDLLVVSRCVALLSRRFLDSHVAPVNPTERYTLSSSDAFIEHLVRTRGPWPEVKAISGQLQMSQSAFSRAFRRTTGQGFCDCAAVVRLAEACRLLATTSRSTKGIAADSGFDRTASLDRVFQRWFRMTPSLFRTGLRDWQAWHDSLECRERITVASAEQLLRVDHCSLDAVSTPGSPAEGRER